MKIGIMIIDDAGEHCGMARAKFDEKIGFHSRDLRKLYREALNDLLAKLKKSREGENSNGSN